MCNAFGVSPKSGGKALSQVRPIRQHPTAARICVVTLQDLYIEVPVALREMECEFFGVGGGHFDRDMASQETACFMLAIRAASMLTTMGRVLEADSFDAYDVLQRAFMETRDLLSTFRFDRDETRKRIRTWFKGKEKDAWKADHAVCERFLNSVGAKELQLARKWGMFSALSHPTQKAVFNSVAVRGASFSARKRRELVSILEEKAADYITAALTLLVTTSFELKGWVPLGCDLNRMQTAERLRIAAPPAVMPVLARVEARDQSKPRGTRP